MRPHVIIDLGNQNQNSSHLQVFAYNPFKISVEATNDETNNEINK